MGETMRLNTALLVASLLTLIGCGGGNGSTTSVTTPTSVGVLTDSAVGGVQYTTSGGYSGVTDANGQYKFNPGDTVTFKIGAITLGTVTAAGTITPIQLAGSGGTSANKVINLLVLLQSLDADNNPANGITINAATLTAAANAGSLDLTQAPAQFANSSNNIMTSIMSGAGLTRTTLVDPAAAQVHFKEEFFKQIQGSWNLTTNEKTIVFQIDETGKYTLGEVGIAQGSGSSGTEAGQIVWNPVSGVITPSSIQSDTNGGWGMSHTDGGTTLRLDGDKLIFTASALSTTFVRIARDASNPLIGTWAMMGSTFTFLSNGKYIMADPVGDTEAMLQNRTPCSLGGIEYGNYTFNVATGAFAVPTKPSVDTNDCAGAWDKQKNIGAAFTITFNEDKSKFTADGMSASRLPATTTTTPPVATIPAQPWLMAMLGNWEQKQFDDGERPDGIIDDHINEPDGPETIAITADGSWMILNGEGFFTIPASSIVIDDVLKTVTLNDSPENSRTVLTYDQTNNKIIGEWQKGGMTKYETWINSRPINSN
jgi:hypothetical protein